MSERGVGIHIYIYMCVCVQTKKQTPTFSSTPTDLSSSGVPSPAPAAGSARPNSVGDSSREATSVFVLCVCIRGLSGSRRVCFIWVWVMGVSGPKRADKKKRRTQTKKRALHPISYPKPPSKTQTPPTGGHETNNTGEITMPALRTLEAVGARALRGAGGLPDAHLQGILLCGFVLLVLTLICG